MDAEGRRAVIFELKGLPRQLSIPDRSVQPKVKPRVSADPAVPAQTVAALD